MKADDREDMRRFFAVAWEYKLPSGSADDHVEEVPSERVPAAVRKALLDHWAETACTGPSGGE